MIYRWHWFIEWQTPSEFHAHEIERVYQEQKSKYQEVKLVELTRFGKSLIIDGKIQSTVSDEFIYHESLVHPLMLSLRDPERALIIGGGEGATLREVLRYNSFKEVVMVDIDDVVIEFAKKYMAQWHKGAFEDKRTKLVIEDGIEYLRKNKDEFDVIILDLTDPMKDSPSYKLYTSTFYELVKDSLSHNGGISTQATSPSFSIDSFSVISNTIRHVFGKSEVGVSFVPAFDGLWGFAFYSPNSISPMSQERVDRLLEEKGINGLQYYDGTTHYSMFSIPKYIRKYLENENRISTDDNPIYVPA
ncbi:spermidine synthase [Sulfolobales archaeon HS-7]|nr:spermidine synthase [Sulfolobales archaeon HS-7]